MRYIQAAELLHTFARYVSDHDLDLSPDEAIEELQDAIDSVNSIDIEE